MLADAIGLDVSSINPKTKSRQYFRYPPKDKVIGLIGWYQDTADGQKIFGELFPKVKTSTG
jgi:hypothetical protein